MPTLAEAIAGRRRNLPSKWAALKKRRVDVVVHGYGKWARDEIRPDLIKLHSKLHGEGHPGLKILYVGRDFKCPDNMDPDFEEYFPAFARNTESELARRLFDVVIIATPDFEHIQCIKEWRTRYRTAQCVLVEKPFADNSFEINELADSLDVRKRAEAAQLIYGIDHYGVYASDVAAYADTLSNHIGRVISVQFRMLEKGPIEVDRLRTLQSGLIFDMASHFFGLMALLYPPMIDAALSGEAKLLWSGLHDFSSHPELSGRIYFAETAAEWEITGTSPADPRANGRIGKAADESAKQVTFLGTSGGFQIELSATPSPVQLLNVDGVPQGTLATRRDRKDPARHGRIIDAMIRGDKKVFGFLLEVRECIAIVQLLEELRRQSVAMQPYQSGGPEWRRYT